MSEESYQLRAEAADRLLACADGNAALLYLHILTNGGSFSLTAAARDLRRSETEIACAADTLRRVGLLPKPAAPLPQSELPAVKAEDILRRAKTDGAFRGVVAEAEKTLGRVLSSHDLEILFGLYDHLGLPADVLMVLLHHCVEEYQARSGPGRMPSMRYIEKEGWFWAEQEIMDLGAAEAHLKRDRARQETVAQVRSAMQIHDRSLSKSEREYVESWIAMGFGAETIALAYDRTAVNTGRLSWGYMDKILKSWDAKRLYTPEDVEAGDPARRSRKSAAAPVSNTQKIDRMRKVYNSMKKTDDGGEA